MPAIPSYAGHCFQQYIDHFMESASLGHEEDQGLVDAILLAEETMPRLLPAAFDACIQQQEREAQQERELLAQSIDQELKRVERKKQLQQEAERAKEAEQRAREAEKPTQCNAEDISRMIIDQMAVLSKVGDLADELTNSLRSSIQLFFDDTMGNDRVYLTKAAIAHVDRMRTIESDRIKRTGLTNRAALSMISHVGKIMSHLPAAITQTLGRVDLNPEAPPIRFQAEDEAEFEEEPEDGRASQPQGLPASGTPPDPPPMRDPGEPPIPSAGPRQIH